MIVSICVDCSLSYTDTAGGDSGDLSNFCVMFPSHFSCSISSKWFSLLLHSFVLLLFIFMLWMTLFTSSYSLWPMLLGISMCCVKCVAKSFTLRCTLLHMGQINGRFIILIKLVRNRSTLEKHDWQHNGHDNIAIITNKRTNTNTRTHVKPNRFILFNQNFPKLSISSNWRFTKWLGRKSRGISFQFSHKTFVQLSSKNAGQTDVRLRFCSELNKNRIFGMRLRSVPSSERAIVKRAQLPNTHAMIQT